MALTMMKRVTEYNKKACDPIKRFQTAVVIYRKARAHLCIELVGIVLSQHSIFVKCSSSYIYFFKWHSNVHEVPTIFCVIIYN